MTSLPKRPRHVAPGSAAPSADGVPPPVVFPQCVSGLYPEPEAYAPVPWAEFRAEILALYEPPLRARSTRDKMRYTLDFAGRLLEGGTTADLTPALIARFITARPPGESANSTLVLIGYLRAAAGYAEMRGYVRRSPFAFRKQWVRPTRPRGHRHHSREEIRRVLDLMRRDVEERRGWARWRARRLYAVAATVAYTGLRKMEALHLRVEDVDLAGRLLLIVERGGRRLKTERSSQPVPIPDALTPILVDWMGHRLDDPGPDPSVPPASRPRPRDGGWLFPNLCRYGPWTGGQKGAKPLDRMKAVGERAGVEGFTFLSLRHSFATHSEFWGLSPAMIQRVLRHTTQRTQDHYRHADLANLREATRGIDFGPASPVGEATS